MSQTNPKPSDETANDQKAAMRVLQNESEALQALANAIDTKFSAAVQAIDEMKNKARGAGRVIVAGIGKSGHVARKIAATMASTGTPAYYVHPGEASHGDMGMITENDIVLMLSNSGENSELSDLIHYTRRYNITLIAITSNPDSTLGKHADIPLILPKMPEACPNGLAPTTSTTMMIALGDALSVALLERMGLTPEQYKVFHPGGKLGQRLLKVSEMMIPYTEMAVIEETAMMQDAIVLLAEKNLGNVVVSDDQRNLIGIITDGDLKRHMDSDLLQKPVSAVMTTNPKTIHAGELAVKALEQMTGSRTQYLTSLIVMDNERVAGLIRLQDCLNAGLA